MALKGSRQELETSVRHFMDEVAERGGVAVISTAASGEAMDNSVQLATYSATGSGGVPVGILLNDMVNLDLTRTHINQHKDEVQQGNKVTLLKKGWITTDYIHAGVTPSAGDTCYVGPSGFLSSDQAEGNFPIGEFDTIKDEDGFAVVNVNIPHGDRPTLA